MQKSEIVKTALQSVLLQSAIKNQGRKLKAGWPDTFFVSGDNKVVVMPLKAVNPNFDDKYFKNIYENAKKYAFNKTMYLWVDSHRCDSTCHQRDLSLCVSAVFFTTIIGQTLQTSNWRKRDDGHKLEFFIQSHAKVMKCKKYIFRFLVKKFKTIS